MHALDEAWRVLMPQGRLIDLRPYCLEMPLELVRDEHMELIDSLDSSASEPDDRAADQAFAAAVHRRIIKQLTAEFFHSAYYWSSVEELLADYNEKWNDDIVLPGKVVSKAHRLVKKQPGCARLRIVVRSKLVVYERQG